MAERGRSSKVSGVWASEVESALWLQVCWLDDLFIMALSFLFIDQDEGRTYYTSLRGQARERGSSLVTKPLIMWGSCQLKGSCRWSPFPSSESHSDVAVTVMCCLVPQQVTHRPLVDISVEGVVGPCQGPRRDRWLPYPNIPSLMFSFLHTHVSGLDSHVFIPKMIIDMTSWISDRGAGRGRSCGMRLCSPDLLAID
jgi:hypothetical protein